jgi:hypothetical protein
VKTNLIIAVLVVVGLLGYSKAYHDRTPAAICGSDFPVTYAGAKLAFSPDLYLPEAAQQIEQQEMGCATLSAAFIRLPYYAVLLRPLAWLPFRTAFVLWRTASLIAILAFLVLCRAQWKWALLACAWSKTLVWDLDNGQDVAFLLLVVTASMALVRRRMPFAAGLCLALCANKFHLFLLLPLLLVQRQLRKTAAGALTGGVVLLAICFATRGWNWPGPYLKAISNPLIDIAPMSLLNLRGLVRGSLIWEILLGLTVVAAVWLVCRRASFELGLASVIAGGLLVSHHHSGSDWALMIPVALIVVRESSPFSSALAILLITPLVPRLNQPAIVVTTLLVLVYALAVESLRRIAAVESKDSAIQTAPAG